MMAGDSVTINGDGQTSRDFCYVANAVQANIRAALAADEAQGEVYNVAVGERTSLVELFSLLVGTLGQPSDPLWVGAGIPGFSRRRRAPFARVDRQGSPSVGL